jgi:hypothetical protein
LGYQVPHWTGSSVSDFPVERFDELLDELADADSEHPDVSITHESEWSLSVYKSGIVVLENLEEGEPVHMGPIDRDATLGLMTAIADGRIDQVRAAAWKPGYPSPENGKV